MCDLTSALFERIDSCEPVVRTGGKTADAVDRRGKCHENVSQWSKQYPFDRPVRGWLVDQSHLQDGFVDFHAHSIIATIGNRLIDVTLCEDDPDYCFLRDGRPDEAFLILAKAHPTLRHIVDQARYDIFQSAVDAALLNSSFDGSVI